MAISSEDGAIHVAFAADENYAMPLAVSLCSAATNCDKNRELIFHIVCDNFGPGVRAKLERSLKNARARNATIIWHDVNLSTLIQYRVANNYMNHLIYARLLLPEVLDASISKVLYLDSDVVVLDDIAKLWDIDVSGKSIFAVRDRIGSVGAPDGLLNWESLGIPADTKYFNSGVLLINLDDWRTRDVGSRVLDYLQSHRQFNRMGDQDGLNAILFDCWGELPFRWNWQVIPDIALAKKRNCWGLELQEKSIVHFVTAVKPWLPACQYKEKTLFYQYLDRTDWSGWRVPIWKEWIMRSRKLARKIVPRASV